MLRQAPKPIVRAIEFSYGMRQLGQFAIFAEVLRRAPTRHKARERPAQRSPQPGRPGSRVKVAIRSLPPSQSEVRRTPLVVRRTILDAGDCRCARRTPQLVFPKQFPLCESMGIRNTEWS